VPLPRLPPSRRGLVEFVPTSKATALFAGRGEATALAVLVHGLDDPVDARITADGLVLRVDKDDFVVLVRRVLVDPVRVEDAEIGAAAADALLGSRLERPLVLELVDTLVGGLAIRGTLGRGPLATTTADTNAVDDITLLGLVPETASLVRTGRAASTVDDLELAKLPAANAHQEAHHVRLLLLLKFLDIFEGTHLCGN